MAVSQGHVGSPRSSDDNHSSGFGSAEEYGETWEKMDSRPRKRQKHAHKSKVHVQLGMNGAYTGEVFKSSLFKLQVDELLSTVKPSLATIESAFGEVLQAAKAILESLPSRESIPISQATRHIQAQDKIVVPLPEGRALVSDNYMIHFQKPSHINVTGSYALKTTTWSSATLGLDLVVTMPEAALQEKDFLNYRYLTRRAYYLSFLAAGFDSEPLHQFRTSFEYAQGNPNLPILVLEPVDRAFEKHAKIISKCRVKVLPIPTADKFDVQKLAHDRNCVRGAARDHDGSEAAAATPFHNASVLQDALSVEYLKTQHAAAKQCEQYRDACSLGRTWLRQRGFSSRIQDGGFGNAEWSILTALLLQGGGNKGQPLFSQGYSSYQLFKAMLQYLRNKDLVKAPQVISGTSGSGSVKSTGLPILLDGRLSHNILYRMSAGSYRLLQDEARVTIAALADATCNGFEAAFILRTDVPLCQYDATIEIPLPAILELDKSKASSWAKIRQSSNRIYETLYRALGTRVKMIRVHVPASSTWPIDKAYKYIRPGQKFMIGFMFDEKQIHRLVDHGPSADMKEAAAKFADFWGSKSELRRFRDGRVVESVVWTVKPHDHTVFRQAVSFILNKHFGELENSCKYAEYSIGKLIPGSIDAGADRVSFQSAFDAFLQLEIALKSLENMPLRVSQVLASHPQLSFTDVSTPHRHSSGAKSGPAAGVIELEGSARWPDDLDAIQRTKLAFLLQIATSLETAESAYDCRVGLENLEWPYMNQGYLDLRQQDGITYRLRIRHDREVALLERQVKDTTATQQEKLELGRALAVHKENLIKTPAHCQAIRAIALRFPSFSPAVRLVKHWFASHLLSPFFSEPLIEMLVAKVYTSPYPWQAPASAVPALLRTILLLDRWDWIAEPWVVNLGTEPMSEADMSTVLTRFEAWRKIDPGMNRVVLFAASSVDHDGTTWTDYGRPPKVVAARMTAVAKAAAKLVREKGTSLVIEHLFQSSLSAYEFTIQLDTSLLSGVQAKKSNGHAFKNLELQATDDFTQSGLDVFASFVAELQSLYTNAFVLFYDNDKRDVLAGLWNPQTKRAWKLRLGYSSVPTRKQTEADDADESELVDEEVEVNRNGILNEIARLGGSLVKQIKQK